MLLTLGDPDKKKDNDEQFLYVRESEEGGIAFLVGGGMRGGVTGVPVTFRILAVGFDGKGMVSEVKSRKFIRRDFGASMTDASLWGSLDDPSPQ